MANLSDADAVALYNALRTYESDFDKAQGSLRTIASAWLLATIGGLGLSVQMQTTATPLDPGIAAGLRGGLLLLSSLGLMSLWYLDLRVYQQLLHSTFSVGVWMEYARTTLPPARIYLYLLNRDITHSLGWFYRAPLWVLLMVGLVNTLAYASFQGRPWKHHALALSIAAVLFLLQVGFFASVRCRSKGWPKLEPELPPDIVVARNELSAGGALRADLLTPATPGATGATAAAATTAATTAAATTVSATPAAPAPTATPTTTATPANDDTH